LFHALLFSALEITIGMQRYIKKIGYKQDPKRQMLSGLINKCTYIKSIKIQKKVSYHKINYLIEIAKRLIDLHLVGIYKSLTKN